MKSERIVYWQHTDAEARTVQSHGPTVTLQDARRPPSEKYRHHSLRPWGRIGYVTTDRLIHVIGCEQDGRRNTDRAALIDR
jgi:hypothetical protein